MRVFAEGLTSHNHFNLWIFKVKPLVQCIFVLQLCFSLSCVFKLLSSKRMLRQSRQKIWSNQTSKNDQSQSWQGHHKLLLSEVGSCTGLAHTKIGIFSQMRKILRTGLFSIYIKYIGKSRADSRKVLVQHRDGKNCQFLITCVLNFQFIKII